MHPLLTRGVTKAVKPSVREDLKVSFARFETHLSCREFSIIATPGHSPGHFSIHVRSLGEEALLIGDVAHDPCQLVRLDWCSTIDSDSKQAIRTRPALFSRFAGTPARILGGHFTGGTIVRDGDVFRLAM